MTRETYYLLDIGPLVREPAGQQGMTKALEALLDRERLFKYQSIKAGRAKIQSLGAGALLRLAFEDANKETAETRREWEPVLSPEDLLERLAKEKATREVRPAYRHGPKGKPYFAELPLYFSLSHSGELVACAISEKEVGLDLQEVTSDSWQKLSKRFFSKEEQEFLLERAMTSEADARRDFFRFWSRKEAYGKQTGEGVAPYLNVPFLELPKDKAWQEKWLTHHGKAYCICLCREK